MMRVAALALVVFLVSFCVTSVTEAQTPPRPEQPRPDIFECGLNCNLQDYNPTNVKAKQTRTAAYRLQTEPGCSTGTIPQDMVLVEQELLKFGMTLLRNDSRYDFIMRINCGNTHIAVCGSLTVFCLNRGYPQRTDIDISDILSIYQPVTRLSILLHEVMHAIATWNEQYARCGASCGFMSSPGWRDIMNTGPDSRHGLEQIELERWERTMWLVQTCVPGTGNPYWNPCVAPARWFFLDGWSFDPVTSIWYDPENRAHWTACNADGLRWDLWDDFQWDGVIDGVGGKWHKPGSTFFDPRKSYGWASAGPC